MTSLKSSSSSSSSSLNLCDGAEEQKPPEQDSTAAQTPPIEDESNFEPQQNKPGVQAHISDEQVDESIDIVRAPPDEKTDTPSPPTTCASPIGHHQYGDVELKKEVVSSEYTLEWWYDMGPTIPNSSANKDTSDRGASQPNFLESPPEWKPSWREKRESMGDVKSDEDTPKTCKVEREVEEAALENGQVEPKPDPDEFAPKDTKPVELTVASSESEKESILSTIAMSHGQCGDSPAQEDCAINLTVPKTKESIVVVKEDRASPACESAGKQTKESPCTEEDFAAPRPKDNVTFSSAPKRSALSSMFPHDPSKFRYTTSSESYLPWSLGLCRAPLYTNAPLTAPKAVPSYQANAFNHNVKAAHDPPASQGMMLGVSVTMATTAHARLNVASTARSLAGVATSPYAGLQLRDVGTIGSLSSPFLPNPLHPMTPFYGHGDRFRFDVPRLPGLVFLASHSSYFQNFPYLAVMPPGQEQTNHLHVKMEPSNVSERSTAKHMPTLRATDPLNPSSNASKPSSERSELSNRTTEKIDCAERMTDRGDSHDGGANNRTKKSKASRKASFMEALGFVDPTRIKLSPDDEESNDNELMKEIEGNNSSDEDWMPEVNEGKTREECLRVQEDSSTDETEMDKSRKGRDGRKHRSNGCRRGRPNAKAIACPTCGKVFHGKYHLKRHEMSHTETRPFECATCGKRFKQKAHLQGHEMIHQRQKSQAKQKVGKSPNGNLMEILSNKCSGRPKKNYSDKELSCTTCQKSFKTLYRLKRHVQSHTDERPYSCRICGKGFKQTGHRNEHEANHEKNRRKFLCNMCGVIFRCRSSFNNHLKGHRCDTLSSLSPIALHRTDRPGERDMDNHLVEAVNRTGYDCPYCSDKFSTAQGLNRHLDSHIEVHQRLHVQPYTCKHCSRSFTYKHNLLKHMLAHLAPEKYALYHKTKLEQHVASGKPCFKCNTCSKMFIRKETLVKHSKIHTGYKPFKCMICGKEFSQNVHLKVHMRKHTGNRPFQCKRCNRGFIDSTALAKHIEYEACIIENVFYNCKICDKRHYYLGSIKQHIQKHHRKEDVEQFINRIQRHRQRSRKSRNDKSQHTCLVCSSTFTEKGNLVRHVKRKHKDLMKMLDEDIPDQVSPSPLCVVSCKANVACESRSPNSEVTTTRSEEFEPNALRIVESPDGDGRLSIAGAKPALDSRCEGELNELCESGDNSQASRKNNADLLKSRTDEVSLHSSVSFKASKDKAPNDSSDATNGPAFAIDLSISSSISNTPHLGDGDGKAGIDKATDLRIESKSVGDLETCGATADQPADKTLSGSAHQRETFQSQDHNAVSFLYQFGLMVSEKAKRLSDAGKGESKLYCKKQNLTNHRTFGQGTTVPSEQSKGKEPDTNSIDRPKRQEEYNDGSDAFAIDLSCRSQQPRSDLELFCNLALMTESSDESTRRMNGKSDRWSNATNTRYSHDQGNQKHDNTPSRTEDGTAFTNSSEPEHPDFGSRFKDIRPRPILPLKDTLHIVRPWLKQLLGQSPRCQRQHPLRLPPAPSGRMKSGGEHAEKSNAIEFSRGFEESRPPEGKTPQKKLCKEDECNDTCSTTVTESDLNNGVTDGADAISVTDKERENEGGDFSPGKDADDHDVSSRGTMDESTVCASRKTDDDDDDDGGSGRGDANAFFNDLQRQDSDEQSPLVVCMSNSNSPQKLKQMPVFQTTHIESFSPSFKRLQDRTTKNVVSESSPALNLNHLVVASGDVALTPAAPLGSSREAMTQTQSTPDLVTPRCFGPPPLTMTFVLRTPEDISHQAAASGGAGVSGTAPFNRSCAGPGKAKESYPCQTCGKCFNARHQLKRHEMTHTEIRPYGCPECGRAFRQKVHLSDHMKRHGGQRPFACQACGKRFVLKNELKQHAKNYCRKMVVDLELSMNPHPHPHHQFVSMPSGISSQ